MRFNEHSRFEGSHAFLSPSKYQWVNYDDDRLISAVHAHMAARKGTQLHALAKDLIDLGVKLPETHQTLNEYVNDCIGFRMSTEQTLFYSAIIFGTTDAISFSEKTRLLRIFDLKTGLTESNFQQLRIYAALFCLEYGYKPNEIEIELRIYQNDAVRIEEGNPLDISVIMSRIVYANRLVTDYKEVNG